ncbi:MAG TPA: helix-turn-helix domain-containing protein [Cyclobacteriaceae bacterium]|nr:helix-turn-helix domain-containing protein [Cyclobacteriaceae bacterium]
MFYLGGVGLAFFLTLLLLSKSNKTTADKILAAWLFTVTLHILFYYFRQANLYSQLLAVDFPLPLVHGPFLLIYTLALTRGYVSKIAMLHFLPALCVLLYLIPFFTLPTEEKISIFKNQGAGYEVFNMIRTVANLSSGVVYVILASMVLSKHRKAILHQFSSTEKINLQWLQYLSYWIGLIWLFVLFGNEEMIYVSTVFFILFIGFFGIRQVGIFHSPQTVHVPEQGGEVEAAEKKKYQKSGLSSDNSESLHRNLSLLMSNEKLFRESELSLTELAKRLNTQPNYLSRVINEREGKNFYDYINTLRIEEFKRLAANPDSKKYTLLGLAQECGFNSKSSFNRYFKKMTGKSPSEFMQG